ncbi:MAG: ribosome maturation factor RimP [Burkholderiaceae bacterium]
MDWQRAVLGTVTGLGYELVDAQRSAGGLLRVFIDKIASKTVPEPAAESVDLYDDAGAQQFITVQDCEKVTRQLQHVLEVEGCDYQRLEVSSPGLDRPLKKQADFERFAGEQIDLTLKLALQGRKKYRGELRAHGALWRVVIGVGESEQALDFLLEDVREARLVPVLDFKGRRSAGQELPAPARPIKGVQGDRIQ